MERKSHYRILGVASTESSAGIRAAFRDLARKLHPDVGGEAATRAFQNLTEAYGVLSDPGRRLAYNEELRRGEEGGLGSIPRDRRFTEPLAREPVSILGNRAAIRPSYEAMFDRFLRNFTGRAIPKSEHLEGLNLEVLLTTEEAVNGCILPLGVPVFERCPRCGGSGRDWALPCGACQRQGVIETERRVRIRIPPMPSPGSVLEVPLHGLGIQNFFLRLHLVVET